jgi:mRNA-decapping enzyme 1B
MSTLAVDKAKQAEYNLAVLKRRDTQIESILGSAGHVVLYQFNEENKAWDRKNVEGSLFVVKRASAPQHQFVVLNRLSSENLVETVDETFQTELTEQFLLYRNSSSEILGVWFYSPPERASIADLLASLTSSPQPGTSEGEPPPADQKDASDSSNNVAQFFNMMAGAQQAPPPMPARAVSAADAGSPNDAASTTPAPLGVASSPAGGTGTGAGTGAGTGTGAGAAAAGTPGGGGRPPVDMGALKVKLAGQLRALVDDDAFMSLLANEYLRQQQRAFQQAQQARQQRGGGKGAEAAPANPDVPTHLAGLFQQQASM